MGFHHALSDHGPVLISRFAYPRLDLGRRPFLVDLAGIQVPKGTKVANAVVTLRFANLTIGTSRRDDDWASAFVRLERSTAWPRSVPGTSVMSAI